MLIVRQRTDLPVLHHVTTIERGRLRHQQSLDQRTCLETWRRVHSRVLLPLDMPSDAPTLPSLSDRIALHLLQLGAIAVVIAAVTFKQFELDRFFVPKELVLHLTALLATICCLARARELRLARVDQLLGAFLVLGILSALFATNWWL